MNTKMKTATIRVDPSGGTTWFVSEKHDGAWNRIGVINYPGNIPSVPYHAVSEEFYPLLNGGRGAHLHNACLATLDEAVEFIVRQCAKGENEAPKGMHLNAVRMLDGNPVNCYVEDAQ